MVEKICILGATGSIGSNTLDVIRRNSKKYQVCVLTANKNYKKLVEQCEEFKPALAILACRESAEKFEQLASNKGLSVEIQAGDHAINSAANFAGLDIVVAAIVGAAGLIATMTAVEKGLKILLANKEALVMSGELFMSAVKEHQAILLPVDSEHNAIFQSLPNIDDQARTDLSGVDKVLLTGSGGPFLTEPLSELKNKTPEQACAHPNWEMGRKISVDSATMMNKGLEFIEACYLFDLQSDQLQIVIHPQSIIHSMVSYVDGSVLSQMGNPDMRTPIAHCLAWPERIDSGVKPLNFLQLASLEFQPTDFERFPCLALAITAMKDGKNAPCILNAANEMAVEAFLKKRIKFTDIAKVIEHVMDDAVFETCDTISQILASDAKAREIATRKIEALA